MIANSHIIWTYILLLAAIVESIPVNKRDIKVKTVYQTYIHTVYQTNAAPSEGIENKEQKASTTLASTTNNVPTANPTNTRSSSSTSTPSSSSSGEATESAGSTSSDIATASSSSKDANVSIGIDINISSDFSDNVQKVYNRFWSQDQSAWNSIDSTCGGYNEPAVWDQAVAGRAITFSKDIGKIYQTTANIEKYKNSELGAFSSSTNGDNDVYSDDNAQVAWVFIDAYSTTGNEEYLDEAKSIVEFLKTQADSNGGIIWKYQANYIASISTVEAALAAMRLFQITKDQDLVDFSEKCMRFMFDYFQDPSDKLFYDGLDKKNYKDLNKGKLSYTVGCALSTLTLLYKNDGNSTWLSKAKELASAATNSKGAFYDDNGLWNNQLQYVHLLYDGFADLIGEFGGQSDFSKYKDEVIKQGQFVIDYLQDPNDDSLYYNSATSATKKMYNRFTKKYKADKDFQDDSSNHCDNDVSKKTKKIFMDNSSAAQILYALQSIA